MVTRWLPAAPVQAQVEGGNISPQNRNNTSFLFESACSDHPPPPPRGASSTNWLKPGILNRPLAQRHGVTLLARMYQYLLLQLGMGSISPVSHKREGRRWAWLLQRQPTVSVTGAQKRTLNPPGKKLEEEGGRYVDCNFFESRTYVSFTFDSLALSSVPGT